MVNIIIEICPWCGDTREAAINSCPGVGARNGEGEDGKEKLHKDLIHK